MHMIVGYLVTDKGNKTSDKLLRAFRRWGKKIKGILIHRPPFMNDYGKSFYELLSPEDYEENVIPAMVPQWDHTPRSGWNGSLFVNATPKNFYHHAKDVLAAIKPKSHPIVFLKSWNEWGEGNMMEPDMTYGRGFIEALRKAVDEY